MKTINDYQIALGNIKKLDIDSISEIDIENAICGFGLTFDNRELYGVYQNCMNKPEELGLWQKPDQLAPLIKYLLANCLINSFLEVGTYKASTFLVLREFLYLKNKNLRSLTIDPHKLISDEFVNNFSINYQMADISSIDKQYDLIFIDGDHAYNSVKKDYEKAMSLNPKYVLFHDIQDKYCPGVVRLWNEIKENKDNYVEFKTEDDIMGLGLLILNNK
jgi:hypothetical protein